MSGLAAGATSGVGLDSDESNGPPSIPTSSGISSEANSTPPPPPPPSMAVHHGGGQVLLKDVAPLVRLNLVAPPAGFSKLGHPLVYFPDDLEVRTLQYLIAVILYFVHT